MVRITVEVTVYGIAKFSPQKVRDKRRAQNRVVLNHPDQLITNILETITTGEDLSVTRLTCNGGVIFRNWFDCWWQWPSQCSWLWSWYLLIWIWISWKIIHHRMSVSNSLVLFLKIWFLLSTGVSQKYPRLSSHIYSVFRLLKCRKISE